MTTRLSLLVDLGAQLAREVDLQAWLDDACQRLTAALSAERATIWLVDAGEGDLVAGVSVPEGAVDFRQPISRGLAGHVARTGETVRVDDPASDDRFDRTVDLRTGFRTRSVLAAAVREHPGEPVRAVVQVLNRVGGAFSEEDARYLEALSSQLARAISWTTLRAEVPSAPGVTPRGRFNRIVGTSPAIEEVYKLVERAAKTEASVLFLGETGTGKSLFARAVHVNSSRRDQPLVTVDCTTLPAPLVESELFGHERGAFTGAERRTIGRVETARGGTLFLDEVGDLPLESQGKLLRLVQDREFERVGGRQTIRADVRLVAATHRDLEAAVRDRAFREDLYYRLKVITIRIPPLRDRGQDEIVTLARHFAAQIGRQYFDEPATLSAEAIETICEHNYPGNVRELEHAIESAVVLGEGRVERIAFGTAPGRSRSDRDGVWLPGGLDLGEASARYARFSLERAGGNKSLAARALGIGRNTLARILAGKGTR